jgi:hypothetical protein
MSGPTEQQVVETLQAAKELLLEGGWVQGMFCDQGQHCLDGALRKVICGSEVIFSGHMHEHHYQLLQACLKRLGFNDGQDAQTVQCHNWNDQENRTVEQVFARLNDAIEGKEHIA